MEARLCGGDEVIVVGGGNSAGQAAVFLARHARHARRVHIVIRGDDLGKSMLRYLVERLARLENVTVHPFTEIHALDGTGRLAGVTMRRLSGEQTHIAAHALFIFIGAVPHTAWLTDCVELDRAGFVVTGPALSAASLDTDAWRRLQRWGQRRFNRVMRHEGTVLGALDRQECDALDAEALRGAERVGDDGGVANRWRPHQEEA